MKNKKTAITAVVDEGVSAAQLTRFRHYAETNGLNIKEFLHISVEHPGMPDHLILQHLLHDATLLITKDRPFHNTALAKGVVSYYLDGESITDKPLQGIRTAPPPPTLQNETIKESYLVPTSQIRALFLPKSERQLKKLRTKRRRIRNHFGGLDNIARIAVTVSWISYAARTVIGVKIQASATAGMKAITACESYPAEKFEPEIRGVASLCHALVALILLSLDSVPTVVYYDSRLITDPLNDDTIAVDNRYRLLFLTLKNEFPRLEFVPVTKGDHLEGLCQKLKQLTTTDTNEITPGNLAELVKDGNMNQFSIEVTP